MSKYLGIIKTGIPLIMLVSVFVILLIPVSAFMIDILLVISMGVAVMVYMNAASIEDWDELSSFPTILLFTSLFRIMLNISTTKKILVDGDAGSVIESAGTFVIGSNIGVGIVVFIILIVFQFIVANGASRTAEVAARFTLDSLPGKQMSIDSDLQQGLISQEEAKEKRKKLDTEIDFYGNMDGAGKFIKGDVIAGIVLTLVNIIAGLIIGMAVQGMSFGDALHKYTILTVGDGVVNQLSSLMIAIASGIVMTRVYTGDGKDVGGAIFTQLTVRPIIAYVASAIFLGIGWLTELPWFPFTVIAIILFLVGLQRNRKMDQHKKQEASKKLFEEQEKAAKESEKVEVITEVEPITLEVGIALVPVVETEKNGETIKDKITMIRKNIAKEVGIKIPSIHIVDNSSLMPYTKYNILIKDSVVAYGELQTNSVLALKTPYTMKEIEGYPTKDPVYGEDGLWISEEQISEAKEYGYTVLDPLNILTTHLDEMVRKHLHELIQRQEVKDLLDNVARRKKVLIDELDEGNIGLSVVQGVLRNLLRERVSIRDLPTILEAILDCKTQNKIDMSKVDDVTAIVRESLSKQICDKNKNESDQTLYVIIPDQDFEQKVETVEKHDGYYINLSPQTEEVFIRGLIEEIENAKMSDVRPILLTRRTDLRFGLAKWIHKYNLPIAVLATNELVPGLNIKHLGTVTIEE